MEYAEAKAAESNPQGIGFQFDNELERLDGVISRLEDKLAFVLSNYAMVETESPPEAEPETYLHGRIRRLERLTNRIITISDRVAL